MKSAVYRLQADEQLIGRLKLVREAGGAALDLAQKQHEAGQHHRSRAHAAAGGLQPGAARSRDGRGGDARASGKLNRLLGVWGADTGWKMSGELPPLPESDPALKGLESLAVTQRLDLAAAQAELGGVVRALGLTKAYRFIGALEFGIDTEHDTDRTNLTGPRMSVELPIFNQGQARVPRPRPNCGARSEI